MGKFGIGARVRDRDGDEGVIIGKTKGEREIRLDNGGEYWALKSELEVISLPGGFKMGDRVRVLRHRNAFGDALGDTIAPGSIVTIAGVMAGLSNAEEQGWTGYKTKETIYWVRSDDIELVVEEPTTQWTPKVGDRVRWLGKFNADMYTPDKVYEIKHPGTHDCGLFGLTDDKGNAESGNHSWTLEGIRENFELVAPETTPFTIEAGKFYRTRDGRKVGPMEYSAGPWPFAGDIADKGRGSFKSDGKCPYFDCYDLVAEWPEETASGVTLKSGDRVRIKSNARGATHLDRYVGSEFTLDQVDGPNNEGWSLLETPYWWPASDLELVEQQPAPTPANDNDNTTLTVTLRLDSEPLADAFRTIAAALNRAADDIAA